MTPETTLRGRGHTAALEAGRLAVPDGADDREALWRLFNDIANAEDGDAENRRLDPEARRFARAACAGMTTLATKIVRMG